MEDDFKTVEEWLEQLEEPYKSSAIHYATIEGTLGDFECDLIGAIVWAFLWSDTIEGESYWLDLTIQIGKND